MEPTRAKARGSLGGILSLTLFPALSLDSAQDASRMVSEVEPKGGVWLGRSINIYPASHIMRLEVLLQSHDS